MSPPAISVLMPVYNAEQYLAAAITSILNQTFIDFELIAIDDGSTDGSKTILQNFAASDSRLRCLFRPNTGIGQALNDGIAVATGEFLARMDADDVALPNRFARQIARFKNEPELVALGSAVIFMDAAGHPVKPCPREAQHERIEQALLAGDGGAIIHPSAMFKREAVNQVGGYIKDRYYEDLDLYLKLARVGRLGNLSEPLLHYRVHPTSVNFDKHLGRHEIKTRILATAHAARGLTYSPPPPPTKSRVGWDNVATHYREWSASSLEFGSRSVAIRHGLNACLAEPGHLGSWKALKYAITAPIRRKSGHARLSAKPLDVVS